MFLFVYSQFLFIFFYLNFFFNMLLSVLGCIDYRINLSKSPMWHDLIGWRKSKGLHPIIIEFNLM